MAGGNGTSVTGFLLMGLSDRPEVRFVDFHAIYSAMLLANDFFLLALCADRRLPTPMYFFLTNVSFLDVSCPTAAAPKILRGLAIGEWRSRWPAGAWPACFLNSPLHVSFTFTLTFCRSNLVDQYYCHAPPSRSAEWKGRAWSTCTSCLLAVAIFIYIRPSSGHFSGSDGFVGILYGTLNSRIDSLRSEKVKGALQKLLRETLGLGSLRHPDGLMGIFCSVLNPLIDSLRSEDVKGALQKLLRERLGLGSLRHP
ncbi:olfactory receptor 5B12-like [Tachyglossus aculeatus]|uniref:olfactory receptor 5B12-like n=1 Tax=Tachyglossus aculeatus TaxID=9261 RepID=UPI0018F280E2|nr:olfactory receptor 5B12-like [Tachyglossus aculeatus]